MRTGTHALLTLTLALSVALAGGCAGDDGGGATDVAGDGVGVPDTTVDATADATADTTADTTIDVGADLGPVPDTTDDAGSDLGPAPDTTADVAPDVAADTGPPEPPRVPGLDPPPAPADELGYTPPARDPQGAPPTPAEIEAFTRRLMRFFAETHYFDWVYRTSHGLDASYDPDMMGYRLWWQDVSMRREGDAIVFTHRRYAENIAKRTVKVIDGAAAGYLLTGDERMAEVAADLMRGMVALSLGLEFEREDPVVKYLQARAVFNHDHEYEVDGRRVVVDYGPAREPGFKWNVHSFAIPDNPTYGSIWVSNMRSKDDVPYMYHTLAMATRAWYEAEHEGLREAARLYIEYMRGFSQSIVDNDWYILTKYEDGEATIAIDATKEGNPPADLGSFVHWEALMGPDAECNAQLGAALAGYGFLAGKGHCERGRVGALFEQMAGTGNWFNHNIYNYFHIAALTTAQLWGHTDVAAALVDGLVERFEANLFDPSVPNSDHREYQSDAAGWLITAASQGYPLNAREARHVMQWYGDSADWYRAWEHWDPWATLPEDQEIDYRAPRVKTVPDGEGGTRDISHVRLVELPYVFEYCYSPLKAPNGVAFIDCDIVADPAEWFVEE